jgi:predicted TIM-barrel fold metal-dependent hydrolase
VFLFGCLKARLQGQQFGSAYELFSGVREILHEISIDTLEAMFREWHQMEHRMEHELTVDRIRESHQMEHRSRPFQKKGAPAGDLDYLIILS